MYIPKANLTTDKTEIVEFMRRFSFATIITSKDNFPTATHLPFVVSTNGDDIILTSHFAKANNHWQSIENTTVLVIFSEPHAYISTGNYEKELSVPTWNYISIHAYGEGRLITATEKTLKILEATIDNFDKSYRQNWDGFPDEYKLKMSKGIVAFEILVTDLQGKKKLSQNRTEAEQRKIIDNLSNSMDTNEKVIAEYMAMNMTNK